MENNRPHALILVVHVYKNTLDNINLADAANEFVDSKGSRKQSFGRFLRTIHNICKIKLTPTYFSYSIKRDAV